MASIFSSECGSRGVLKVGYSGRGDAKLVAGELTISKGGEEFGTGADWKRALPPFLRNAGVEPESRRDMVPQSPWRVELPEESRALLLTRRAIVLRGQAHFLRHDLQILGDAAGWMYYAGSTYRSNAEGWPAFLYWIFPSSRSTSCSGATIASRASSMMATGCASCTRARRFSSVRPAHRPKSRDPHPEK